MKQRLVDFSDPILSAVLFILLKDRTTGKNIIWATEPPPELGAGFADEITLEQIKKCPPVPRVLKRLDEQKQRTKAKAEVFTPSWVCEKMIDMGEENGAMPGTDIPCKIKDWKADKEILFKDVGKGE